MKKVLHQPSKPFLPTARAEVPFLSKLITYLLGEFCHALCNRMVLLVGFSGMKGYPCFLGSKYCHVTRRQVGHKVKS